MSEIPLSLTARAVSPNSINKHHNMYELLGMSPRSAEWAAVSAFALKDMAISGILMQPPLSAVMGLAYRLQDVPRKVSKEPYFKHVLRVTAHMTQDRILADFSPPDQRVICAASLLHDSIELQRKAQSPYSRNDLEQDLRACGMEESELKRTALLVERLTPEKDGIAVKNNLAYIRYKISEFRNKFMLDVPDAHILRLIKSADTLANLEETVDDIRRGRKDEDMGRPLSIRDLVFKGRINVIERNDPHNPFLGYLKEQTLLLETSLPQL